MKRAARHCIAVTSAFPGNHAEAAAALSTPVTELERLAASRDVEVRLWVAANPNTPDSTLATLAQDEDPEVRLAVAENPLTPPVVLDLLIDDEDELVRWAAAETLAAITIRY
jgi:HEAT repeat protein